MNIGKYIKAPKNIKESNYFKRKYFHLVVRIVNGYNYFVSIINPKRYPFSDSKELNQVRERSLKRTDISDHLLKLYEESLNQKPKLIVELGVGTGESNFVLGCVADKYDANMVSVDINPKVNSHTVGRRHFINSDDIKFADIFGNWCRENNMEPKVDILFVDTSHKYEHTVDEIRSWFPYLSDHSRVFFHDTNVQPIYWRKDYSIGITHTHEPRGVIRAIELFLGKSFNEKEDFTDSVNGWQIRHDHLCNGFTILERRGSSSLLKIL